MGCRARGSKPKRQRSMATDPFQLFEIWFAEAQAGEINDPEAMALATADARGRPSVRMVLLKGHGPDGFAFYTNEQSAKGEQLAENPRASLLFHWKSLRRQVRIEGVVERRRRCRGRCLFRDPRARFAARRLGVGSVAPARQPRDVRAALRGGQAAVRGQGRSAPAALARLSRGPGADRILDRPPAPPPRAAPVHARGRRLDRRAALPMTEPRRSPPRSAPGSTTRAAMASIAMALILIGLKAWAALQTVSMAMLGSLADSGLDLVASLVVLLGVRIAARPGRPRPPLRPRQGRGARRAGAGDPDHPLGDLHRLPRGPAAAQRRADRPTRSSASACRSSRWC